ncbi:MAG: hypothetical protein HY244_06360 [Rhizobiales bacterium]|nr:hypothetical protein [Hyphomicrobiales bacterium]
MLTKPTVFILGAGASAAFDFPTGLGLCKRVVERLTTNTTVQILGDAGFSFDQIKDFQNALLFSGKNSVDAFLEHRTEYLSIGKAAMAEALIGFEQPNGLFGHWENNWLRYLYERLNSSFDDFSTNRVAFITFNYDRSLEYFLCTALQFTYGKSAESCATELNKIPIIHLHGRLGFLPWDSGGSSRHYRPEIDQRALEVSIQNIKIIHEDISDGRDRDFENAKRIIGEAERIYFLGFGYNEMNMQRLAIDSIPPGKAWGTAHGVIGTERARIAQTGGSKICLAHAHEDCFVFLRNYVSWN